MFLKNELMNWANFLPAGSDTIVFSLSIFDF